MERLRDQPLWAERVTRVSRAELPSFDRLVERLVEAERAEGWLARCHEEGRHLVPTEELVSAMARLLISLGKGPVVEVCAGDGALASGLRSRGVSVVATDVRPSVWRPWKVRALAASEALEKYRPRVVIGSFVPTDADVDRRVLADAGVHHYLVLNARIGLACGSATLWDRPGWSQTPLPELTRYLVTRHDSWLGGPVRVLHHGEAWLLSRASTRGEGVQATAVEGGQ